MLGYLEWCCTLPSDNALGISTREGTALRLHVPLLLVITVHYCPFVRGYCHIFTPLIVSDNRYDMSMKVIDPYTNRVINAHPRVLIAFISGPVISPLSCRQQSASR